MKSDTDRYSIGELSALTGLPVRTIRFYSDAGLVPEAGCTPAGYRQYDVVAVERLGLVRTLRDLGIDLATVHRVLASEVTMASVAAAHAQVLEVQIRALRLRRAVLRAVAQRGSTPREVELMHKLARYSDEERRRMIHEFLDEVFGGLELDPEFERRMRSSMPELPDEPSPAQVEAWVELAELVGQEDFRRRIRQMAERAASDRAPGSAAPDTAEAQARLREGGRRGGGRHRPGLAAGPAGDRGDRPGVRQGLRPGRRPRLPRLARRDDRGLRRSQSGPVLAAPGRHQRVAGHAEPDARLGVDGRRPPGGELTAPARAPGRSRAAIRSSELRRSPARLPPGRRDAPRCAAGDEGWPARPSGCPNGGPGAGSRPPRRRRGRRCRG